MTPQRLRLSRKKGARLPAGTVNVARPSRWGNPFRVGQDPDDAMTVAEAVAWHRDLLLSRPEEIVRVRVMLAGRDLACWCSLDSSCHGDTLLAVANGWPLPRIPGASLRTVIYPDLTV